ncbi:hypothetical protein FACS1894216_11910 [Synergistales bacterium]|nr:hypothetical protein FACS1894216_11910 [Synergistales bacterium]
MKVIVFGAGVCGRKYIENCPDDVEIVAVADNNWEAFGGGDIWSFCTIARGNFVRRLR